MQVSQANNVKIYNLSAGKSLPEWLSDRKRRKLQQQDVDIRKRIELIQDFEMPGVTTCVKVSRDGNYIMATGIYKPRLRCYDVNNLSMKFERCFDSEAVKMEILSDDYSKIVFLQNDRFVELHSQNGRYYRLRIPKFGRDMKYHYASCDLFLVGDTPEVYRLNLDRGQFLSPFTTEASTINCCDINPLHHLVLVGTEEGRVEAWDPRTHKRSGSVLDCAAWGVTEGLVDSNVFPSVTSVKCKDGIKMGVGLATGQILLYDIRSSVPLLAKDHINGLPIKNIEFHTSQDMVLSMDGKVLKIWEEGNGKPFASIESVNDLNDMCLIPGSGLLFMAQEEHKILSYYVPSLGPAPRWCSFLDNLTEELEESNVDTVYDDYKFVTNKELEELGLDHLRGTNLLRAYMHGFFMDMRLYRKAKAVAEPFSFQQYKKKKIKEKIEAERGNRVKLHQLPKVNKELALELLRSKPGGQSKKKEVLMDDRFKAMFENPDYQIDKDTPEFKLLHPAVTKLHTKKVVESSLQPTIDEEREGIASSDEDIIDQSSDESEEEKPQQKKPIKKVPETKAPQFYELTHNSLDVRNKSDTSKQVFEDRITHYNEVKTVTFKGNRELTFELKRHPKEILRKEENKEHRMERKKIRRSAGHLLGKPKKNWRS